jgi:intracellular sulfur oxidation DsrE/DsrF family protein
MRLSLGLLLLSFIWSCNTPPADSSRNRSAIEESPDRLLIEFVAADSANQARLFKQMDNIWAEVPDMQIEVVVHGPAIFMIQDDTRFRNEIAERVAKGAVFAACGNSIRMRGIPLERIISEVIVVPSAFVEIAAKQKQGWPYVKSDN